MCITFDTINRPTVIIPSPLFLFLLCCWKTRRETNNNKKYFWKSKWGSWESLVCLRIDDVDPSRLSLAQLNGRSGEYDSTSRCLSLSLETESIMPGVSVCVKQKTPRPAAAVAQQSEIISHWILWQRLCSVSRKKLAKCRKRFRRLYNFPFFLLTLSLYPVYILFFFKIKCV